MNNQQIKFKYFEPSFKSKALAVASVLFAWGTCMGILYFMYKQEQHYFFSVFILLISLMYLGFKYVTKLEDKTGMFTLMPDGAWFEHDNKKEFIHYDEIKEISREWYNQRVSYSFSATQSNANEYRIYTSNKTYVLHVARSEEKKYIKALKKLEKKIYKTRMVAFTSSYKNAALTQKQKDAQWEKEKPNCNYSVIKVINILLQKTGLELIDNTD